MKDDLSLDMDEEEDLDSEDSSKETKNHNEVNDASFTTESIVNYGKEYEKLEKIYSKNDLALFNKILELKKISKLHGELDFYKKEKINWKYVYNHAFKKVLLPINLNKIDINKTISIHEISQRIKYCVHSISSMKDKNINNEKKNVIPKIIDIFLCDNNKLKTFSNQINNNFKNNEIKRSNSLENTIFENKAGNNKEKRSILKHLNTKNNFRTINKDKNSNNINIENENENNNKFNIRKYKTHVTINLGAKSHEKFLFKNFLMNNNEGEKTKNNKNIDSKSLKTKNIFILNNLKKKNSAYDKIIKNIPKLYDDILFETNKKKSKANLKREAFMETMDDFNSKNLNVEIKDKTFCENFYYFPLKQSYDKENDLEKRGEKILSYKKMADNLMDILNI